MTIKTKRIFLQYFFAIFISLLLLNTNSVSAAGTASLSISPSTGSYNSGSVLTVTVYEDSGISTINAVSSLVYYDSSKLQYVSSAISSPFTSGPSSGGAGVIDIEAAILGSNYATQRHAVATLTFNVLGGSGSTSITFDKSLILGYPSVQNILTSTSGATYSLSLPISSPNSANSDSASNGSTKVMPRSNVITTNPTTKEKSIVSIPINPGEIAQKQQDSAVANGFLVSISIKDPSNKSISGARVTLGDETRISDINGVASFTNVKPGSYKVVVLSQKGKVTQNINVNEPATYSNVQNFNLTIKSDNVAMNYIIIGSILFLLTASSFVYSKIRSKRKDVPKSNNTIIDTVIKPQK